jgi:hypothetical protein
LSSEVAIGREVATALNEGAANAACLAEDELGGHVGRRHGECVEPILLRCARADVVEDDAKRCRALLTVRECPRLAAELPTPTSASGERRAGLLKE